MQFQYVAKDADGRRQEGILECPDQQAAARTLQEQGCFVLSVRPVRATREQFDWGQVWYALRPLAPRTMAVFFRMLESCLHAGLTVFDSLRRIQVDLSDARLRSLVDDLAEQASQGRPLAEGLTRHAKYFPNHVRELTRVGEQNGCLEEMVDEIARAYERDDRLSRSLRWPIGFLLVSVLPLPVFWQAFNYFEYLAAFWITPERMPAYSGSPWAAAWDMWLRKDGLVCVALTVLILLAVVVARIVLRYPGRITWRDALSLRLPLWGPLARGCAQVRFVRTFWAAYHAGQPYAEAFAMGAAATANAAFDARLQPQVAAVRAGTRVADALRQANLLPRELVGGIAQGEDTGRLEESLQRAVEYLERDQDDTIRAALARSWVLAIFYGLAGGAAASVHLFQQYFGWVFDFTEHLFD